MEFHEQLARFQQRTQHLRFRGLILPGSGQAETAALLIGGLRPARVAFLLTRESQRMPDQVAEKLGCDSSGWLSWSLDDNMTIGVYEAIKAIITEHWRDLPRQEIAVDVTGGFKPMSVGMEKAAHVLNLTTLYVASERDPQNRYQPIEGTQRVELVPDPYAVFGDLEDAEARRLFNPPRYNYSGAERIWRALADRSGMPEQLRQRYAWHASLARMYAAWDSFDIAGARAARALIGAGSDAPAGLRDRLAAQHEALEWMARMSGLLNDQGGATLDMFKELDAVLAALGSLYQNGQRRAAQQRYDLAALMLYRCLELISQRRLACHDISSHHPGPLRKRPGLQERYRAVLQAQGRTQNFKLPERSFGLFTGYTLLAALDDPLVSGYDLQRIEQRTRARNESILAHGLRLITREEYAQFAEVVEELLERFFATEQRDSAAWRELYRFIELDERA